MADESATSSPLAKPNRPRKGKNQIVQPEVSVSPEIAKLSRGRPQKLTAEKSAYSPVVLPERVMLPLDFNLPKVALAPDTLAPDIENIPSSISEETLRLDLAAKLHEIKVVPAAYAYYWQLVFSASFYRLRDLAISIETVDSSPDPSRSFSVRQVAQAAGLEYHNLKNLFTGRGTVRHLHDYQLFLYAQGIEFAQLQFNAQLIDKAYFYLVCLRQTDINEEIMSQLFF